MYKSTIYVFLILILFSCSFNNTFHRPIQIAPVEELTYFIKDGDTTIIEYLKSKKEIILKNSSFEIINEDYRIQIKSFVSSNGNKLNGWLLVPKKIEPVATVLHFHGSAGNLLTQFQLISPLVRHGFQIFMFDYSGYGSSEGKPSHQVILEDGYSAVNYIRDNSEFGSLKTILYGQSYGGYLATIIGSNSQENIDGIVIEGAFSSLKKEAKHKASVFGNFVKSGIKADEEAQKNNKPILVIHSREDKMVPIELGREIFKKANDPKDFFEINGEHVSGLKYYSKEIAERMYRMIIIN